MDREESKLPRWRFILATASIVLFFLTHGAIFALTAQSVDDTEALSQDAAGIVSTIEGTANTQQAKTTLCIPASAKQTPTVTRKAGSTIFSIGIRKWAHTLEFFPTGIFAMLALLSLYSGRFKKVHLIGAAIAICAAGSIFDQTHKIFVPGRYFDWTDLPFDVCGYVLGIAAVIVVWAIIEYAVKKRRNAENE